VQQFNYPTIILYGEGALKEMARRLADRQLKHPLIVTDKNLLKVGIVDTVVAELKERGVEFEDYPMEGTRSPSGAITAGGAKTAWFKDTEGNILALVQSV